MKILRSFLLLTLLANTYSLFAAGLDPEIRKDVRAYDRVSPFDILKDGELSDTCASQVRTAVVALKPGGGGNDSGGGGLKLTTTQCSNYGGEVVHLAIKNQDICVYEVDDQLTWDLL